MPRGRARARKPATPLYRAERRARQSPRARYRAERVDTATVSPTAVTDMSMEYTGITSWYSPMVSAPMSRDRAMRYKNPTTWENRPVAVSSRVPAKIVDKGPPPFLRWFLIHPMKGGLSDMRYSPWLSSRVSAPVTPSR